MTEYNEVKQVEEVTHKGGEEVVEEKPRKKSIVKAPVQKKKRNLMERLVLGILGPDGIPAISNYLGKEIVMPAIKNIVVDSITSGINMAVFKGENRGSAPHSGYSQNPYQSQRTNYNQNYRPQQTQYNRPTQQQQAPVNIPARRNTLFIIQDRREAEQVLTALIDTITQYGSVTLADYLDLIGEEPVYTDNTVGWFNLNAATVGPVRGGRGFVINLPDPVTI